MSLRRISRVRLRGRPPGAEVRAADDQPGRARYEFKPEYEKFDAYFNFGTGSAASLDRCVAKLGQDYVVGLRAVSCTTTPSSATMPRARLATEGLLRAPWNASVAQGASAARWAARGSTLWAVSFFVPCQ
jgi:hypothetical protein